MKAIWYLIRSILRTFHNGATHSGKRVNPIPKVQGQTCVVAPDLRVCQVNDSTDPVVYEGEFFRS